MTPREIEMMGVAFICGLPLGVLYSEVFGGRLAALSRQIPPQCGSSAVCCSEPSW
jgi:hypothetical protein